MSLLVKGVSFKYYGINGKRGGSVYEFHNVCTYCMLKYPKTVYRCTNDNPKCSLRLRSRSWNGTIKVKRIE
jgi:hypothetical protein